ncbi:uncharacterized protein LOC129800686 [Phlebotomus papatasi]|uniref:uncharacterized protein LOC129800686 n=1 Tax=Phlebotomus papatasi TaxID=29031 RepID=UPI002484057E|nr:uncharacterized protein LOC129800686 [Phlebotomus papatasi]
MTFKFVFLLAFAIATISIVGADKISCETCNGLSCLITRGRALKECPSESDSCISVFCNSMILARGCSSLTDTPQCGPTAELTAIKCSEERCELPSSSKKADPGVSIRASSCVQCNQGQNRDCSVNALTLASTICAAGETECYTKMDNGRITRGCLNQLSEGEQLYCKNEEFGENCVTCSQSGCNRDIFPANRLKCHQCDSQTDPSCNTAKSTRTATYCEDHSAENQCLTIISADKRVRRMCTTTPAANCNGAISCSRCYTNGCNNEAVSIAQLQQMEQCPLPQPSTPQPSPSTPAVTPTTTRPTSPSPNGVAKFLPGPLIVALSIGICQLLF